MKKILLAALLAFISLSLTGCGHDNNNAPPLIVTQILSDPAFDGDIRLTLPATFTITQGMIFPSVQSVFAGIDPSTGDESRAFLDFPLTGPNGVPGNAFISSATLDIVLNNVFPQLPGDTIPIRIELVSFPGLTLIVNDYSVLPAIEFTTIVPPISLADAGFHVAVDVTSLMVQAQNSGVLDFQIRILEDFLIPPAPPGLIEINDTTVDPATRRALAPLLQVEYF